MKQVVLIIVGVHLWSISTLVVYDTTRLP